ncbi:hypothetical protein BZL30_4201 [Mycobacterium kansasii]|uniref:Uncharacterized protein n=1 Tax=Mycobacterium kansasii TaxID=1768 RepID=A0A1V3XD55_MYCKA|nr:hypothetical protein BZL30_4201 [Mycobacterium kansasii]
MCSANARSWICVPGFAVNGVVPKSAVGRHAGCERPGSGVAEVFHARGAPSALTAHGDERRHHMVAGREAPDSLADVDHDARAFVSADRRRHCRESQGAQGFCWGASLPWRMCSSEWHNPVAARRTRTSPERGGSRSNSSTVHGRPYS